MKAFRFTGMEIEPEKKGQTRYQKVSYPVRYGLYGEIRTEDFVFGFNRNGEIKTIRGRSGGWLETAEWLKRSAGNDWAYFSAGGYNGAYNYTGEYYVPCLPYQTNAIFGHGKFQSPEVKKAFAAWHDLAEKLPEIDRKGLSEKQAVFIDRITAMPPRRLEERGKALHDIIGGPVTVLPPETRHVEYDVIPLTIADGCLYNCGFCRVKSGSGFRVLSREDVARQLNELREFYGDDRFNYNSVFLGEHDALFAGSEAIGFAAQTAWEKLDIGRSVMADPRLFLFASADSLLRADDQVFSALSGLPFYTHINVGLESGDPDTLLLLQKPIGAQKVEEAFSRMIEINRAHPAIEVSANFVIGADLPETHLPSILELAENRLERFYPKGDIYLSPLENIGPKEKFLTTFNEFKRRCRLPGYLYLIQRL